MALRRKMRRRGAQGQGAPEQGAHDDRTAREKRVFSRVECLLDLELVHEQTEEIEALDLSLLGLGFQRDPASTPLPVGRDVSVGIHGFTPVRAQVRWDDGSRVGVQFCGRLHDIIDSWVGEVLAAQGVRVGDLIEAIRN